MRVGRCPQPPLLAVAADARPERVVAAQLRQVDVWQLGAPLSPTEQVRCASCSFSPGPALPIGSGVASHQVGVWQLGAPRSLVEQAHPSSVRLV